MKKIILLAVATALIAAGCQSKREQEQASDNSQQAKIDSLERVLKQSNAESEDLTRIIGEIRDGFRQIDDAEGRVTKQNSEGSDKQAIIESMEFIRQTLQLNKNRINELNQQLRNVNQSNKAAKAAYEMMVEEFNKQIEEKLKEMEQLRQQLADQNIIIEEQVEQIDRLNSNVDDLTAQNEEKNRKVAEQDEMIHTAWYVFGTKRELREQKILESGDVMRSANANKDYFTKIDTRVTKRIPLYSKSADIKTNHPSDSYTLEKDAQGQYTLRITHPENFWSASKYLVIVVK